MEESHDKELAILIGSLVACIIEILKEADDGVRLQLYLGPKTISVSQTTEKRFGAAPSLGKARIYEKKTASARWLCRKPK